MLDQLVDLAITVILIGCALGVVLYCITSVMFLAMWNRLAKWVTA